MRADEIDFEIKGTAIQSVEIELDPRESVFAESGAMLYMQQGIKMETKLGRGGESKGRGGMFSSLMQAAGNLMMGESLFTTFFTNEASQKRKVSFASPIPGTIIPLNMNEHPQGIIAQRDSFLVSAKGNDIELYFNRKIGTGFFGGEGFVMQKITGDGMAFINAGGHCEILDLKNETIYVDTGCLVAYEPTVSFDIEMQSGIKNMLFGGEGLFLARLSGTGSVVIQNMPLSKLSDVIYSHGHSGSDNAVGNISLFDSH